MFKRIGATILSIVMLLSMASAFSTAALSPMGLEVSFVDSNGDPLTSAMPGETVNAVVKIKNPVAISAMTVAGTYDSDFFTAAAPVIENPVVGDITLKGIAADPVDEKILVAWIAEENVLLADETVLMTVPLTVKADAALEETNISFYFVQDGMLVDDGTKPVALETTQYSAEKVVAPIAISDTPAVDTVLEVIAPEAAVVGQEVTVKINVKNYAQNWSALTIVGSYNDDVLELLDEKTVKHEFKNSEIVDESFIDAANGTIAAAWFNENVVENPAEFALLELTFKVKAIGDVELSFSFKEDDIYGADNAPITAGFSKEPVEKDITITAPSAVTALEVVAPTDAKTDDTITVKVNVKNYASDWSTMTIVGTYDSDKLELIKEEPIDFKDNVSETDAVVDKETKGVLAVNWLNAYAVAMDEEFTALTLTFKVLAEGDAKLSFAFNPEGIKDGDGVHISTDKFESEAAEATVAITRGETKTQLVVDVAEESVKVGQTVTVKVRVKDYKDNWAALSILGKYDATKFELLSHTEGTFYDGGAAGEPQFVEKKGAFGVNWLNDDTVVKGEEFDALELVFKVLSTGDDSKGTFEFSFIPEGILDADGNVAENTFATGKASDEVTLLPNDTMTTLSVKVDKDTAKVGEDIHVYVNVHDYTSLWSAMTIAGRYDVSKVRVKEIIPKEFCGEIEQAEGIEPVIDDKNGEIKVCWANTDAVVKDETFEALEIVFTVLREGDAEFAFAFMEDGVLDANGDKAPANWYDTTEKTDSIVIENSRTDLNVLASTERAEVGETVTYTVGLQGYQDQWLAMAIAAKYDHTKLKLLNATSLIDSFEHFEAAPSPDENGVLNAAWVDSEPVALGGNPQVLELTFEVIGKGDTEVSFEFVPKGIIVDDPEAGAVYAPAESYAADAVEKPIALFVATSLEIVGADKVTENEEYTVQLVLKDYNNAWSSFGAELVYDLNAFVVEDSAKIVANAFGGVDPTVDVTTPGMIRLDWSNAGNMTAGEETVVLTVTFRALSPLEDVQFNANLLDVKTFDGNANVDVDANEYEAFAQPLIVDVVKTRVPHLSVVVENGTAMDEGDDGVLKLYLHEYTSEWSNIPVILNFSSDLIRIKEGDIVCNPLGDAEGQVVLRADEGKIVFNWIALQNIEADGDPIELASIPFRAFKEGEARFDAEFVAHSLLTCNSQGGYDVVGSDTYVAESEEKKVTINDRYPNMDPMFMTVTTVDQAIKNKKESLTLTLDNFNPRMQALSVKLFYDKDKVTITKEDIQEMLGDNENIVGGYVLNKAEGYIHFTWIFSDVNLVNATNVTLANLRYTPISDGQISFYAVFDQVVDNELETMVSVFDYVERSETEIVNVKANPSVSATADKTEVNIGDTVTLTVSVNDYLNLWSNMTINGSYDKNLLRLESITLTDAFGNKSYELGDGSFKAIWSNAANVTAGSSFDAITLVFKVIDCGTATFDITLEDVLTNGATPLIPGVDYLVDAESVDEINIAICEHEWSDTITHKEGTSGDNSVHVLTCTKGCGVIKEVACSITKTFAKATCDKAGTITYNCAICGYNETLNDPSAPALGHKFDGKPEHKDGTKKHVYTCSRGCGTTKEENCSYTTHVENPTCVKDGYTIFTCTVCGDNYTGNVVQANDSHGALILRYFAPNATTIGSIFTECDRCHAPVEPPYAGAIKKKTLKAGHPFPDVQDPTMWYYDAINFNKAFGIFGGDELGNFNPGSNITRGQLVTVLGRIMMAEAEKTMSNAEFNAFLKAQTSKVSGMKSTSGFTDLGGKYYERYAKLFAKWGIVNGYPDGTFGGDKNITREEMATLIKRFVEAYRGSTANITFGNAATFNDFSKVSGWAKSNVEWVGKVGLFQGDTYKNYNPQSNATRAEIAVVIYRMLPVLEKICVCMDPICHSCPWAH
ncbi:MAG: S-layer homology domain-containing protein [Clostridia bacterium]|nr:S-layer homology domain-containing protein [Clostridia bacterium]